MALALLGVLALAAPDGRAADDWAYELANELMSPYCPGRTLADCPSQKAQTLRTWIHVQKAAGRDRAEVEAELLERFGESILAAPRAEGFGIAAYAIPVLAFAAGGLLVAVFLRRQTRSDAPAERELRDAPPDPELERLVDEEISR